MRGIVGNNLVLVQPTKRLPARTQKNIRRSKRKDDNEAEEFGGRSNQGETLGLTESLVLQASLGEGSTDDVLITTYS